MTTPTPNFQHSFRPEWTAEARAAKARRIALPYLKKGYRITYTSPSGAALTLEKVGFFGRRRAVDITVNPYGFHQVRRA